MPVITFTSAGNGCGKTTSAIILATTLARKNRVVAIDADPGKRLMSWSEKSRVPPKMVAHASEGEKHIHREIDEARKSADYVIVDLEGAATRLNAYAVAESDLVIIPMGDEQPDAEGALETLAALALESRSLRRTIPVRILFCRTMAVVKSRLQRSLNAKIRERIGAFSTELHTRTAYSSLHNFGGSLYGMDPNEVTGLTRAIGNAELFAEEVEQVLGWPRELIKAESKQLMRGKLPIGY